MGVIVGGARSLLYISGLDPQPFWDDAVEHRVQLQLVMALPGRPTPWELSIGRRPDATYIRTMGCEAPSHLEKDKRWKFDPKTYTSCGIYVPERNSSDAMSISTNAAFQPASIRKSTALSCLQVKQKTQTRVKI
jgi:hypothetical protein